MRISDWSSDVCSSDLRRVGDAVAGVARASSPGPRRPARPAGAADLPPGGYTPPADRPAAPRSAGRSGPVRPGTAVADRCRRPPAQVEELDLRPPARAGPCLAHRPRRAFRVTAGDLPASRRTRAATAGRVLFDLERPWRIDADALRSKSKNSIFDRRPVQGSVLRTVVDGRSVFVAET